MAIRVVQNGLGKMGSEVHRRLSASDGIELYAAADPYKYHLYSHEPGSTNFCPDIRNIDIRQGDVLVDFSAPAAALDAARYAAGRGGKILVGTTPLPREIEEEIKSLGSRTAVIVAPNYSPDVNRFFYLIQEAGRVADGDALVSVHERHRAEKATVSGTAREIARILVKQINKEGYVIRDPFRAFDFDGSEISAPAMTPDALRNFVQVSYERFGDEPGLHVVTIGDEHDYSRFEVRATRASYARGVEEAVGYISNSRRGLHNFARDVLGLDDFSS